MVCIAEINFCVILYTDICKQKNDAWTDVA